MANSNKSGTVLIAIILTAIIVGGGMYMYYNQESTTEVQQEQKNVKSNDKDVMDAKELSKDKKETKKEVKKDDVKEEKENEDVKDETNDDIFYNENLSTILKNNNIETGYTYKFDFKNEIDEFILGDDKIQFLDNAKESLEKQGLQIETWNAPINPKNPDEIFISTLGEENVDDVSTLISKVFRYNTKTGELKEIYWQRSWKFEVFKILGLQDENKLIGTFIDTDYSPHPCASFWHTPVIKYINFDNYNAGLIDFKVPEDIIKTEDKQAKECEDRITDYMNQ